MYPETKAGNIRATGMHKSLGYNVGEIISPTFSQDTATKTGFSSRTIQQEVQHEAMYPETKAGNIRATGMNKSLGYNVGEIISPTFRQDTATKNIDLQAKLFRLQKIPQ